MNVNHLNIDIIQFCDDLHTKFCIIQFLFKILGKISKISAI